MGFPVTDRASRHAWYKHLGPCWLLVGTADWGSKIGATSSRSVRMSVKGAGGLWYVYAYMIYIIYNIYIYIFMIYILYIYKYICKHLYLLQTFHICMCKWHILHISMHISHGVFDATLMFGSTCCAQKPTLLVPTDPSSWTGTPGPLKLDGMELRWANFTYQVGVFISRWALRGGFPWWVNDVARFWFCIQKYWVIPKGVYLMLFEHNIELHITRYSYRA